MNRTNRYYVDENGNMIGYTNRRYLYRDKIEKPAEPFHSKLKVVRVGWLNSGFYLELQDENGKTYSMNDVMLREYLIDKDIILEGDWQFYQQGTAFSIGL